MERRRDGGGRGEGEGMESDREGAKVGSTFTYSPLKPTYQIMSLVEPEGTGFGDYVFIIIHGLC